MKILALIVLLLLWFPGCTKQAKLAELKVLSAWPPPGASVQEAGFIMVEFNQLLSPGPDGNMLEIEPRMPGTLSVEGLTMRYQLEGPLPEGSYSVRVRAGVKAQGGSRLEEDYSWRFEVTGKVKPDPELPAVLRLEALGPEGGGYGPYLPGKYNVGALAGVRVEFSHPMIKGSAESAFKFVELGQGGEPSRSVEGRFLWSGARSFAYTLNDPAKPGSVYLVSISQSALSWGGRKLDRNYAYLLEVSKPGPWEIRSVSPGSLEARYVGELSIPGQIEYAVASPDGRKVALLVVPEASIGDEPLYELWVASSNGRDASRLTEEPVWGEINLLRNAWFPDGSAICVALFNGEATEIVAYSPGSPRRRLLDSEELGLKFAVTPAVSPDGARIAFLGLEFSESSTRLGVYLMDPASKRAALVTGLDYGVWIASEYIYMGGLSWLGAGGDLLVDINLPEDIREIWRIRSDTGERKLVAQDAYLPVPSPDGSRVGFWRGDSFAVARADGSEERLLLSGDYTNPQWSPDSEMLAFLEIPAGKPVILRAATGEQLPVPRLNAAAVFWGNDGRLYLISRGA